MRNFKLSLLTVTAFTLSLFSANTHASEDEFPLNKNYRPKKDTGFAQYAGNSLRGTHKIVLTFDDGPSTSLTPLVLDILKKYSVKATFFVQGKNINSNTYPILERAVQEGHFLGAHSMEHRRSNDLSESEFKADTLETFKRMNSVFEKAGTVQNEVYYRFPFGAYGRSSKYHHFNALRELSEQIYGENCINFAFWSVDSSDWVAGMTGNEVYENVMASFDGGVMTDFVNVHGKYEKQRRNAYHDEITKGGVILFHDVHTPSIDALPRILETFQKRGIEVVPMNSVQEYNFGNKQCGASPNKKF